MTVRLKVETLQANDSKVGRIMQKVCGIMINKWVFRRDLKGGYHYAEGV
jgi:hypothetical protein